MKQSIQKKLFTLLRAAIIGCNLPESYLSDCTPEEFQGLLNISKKHDITHLLSFAIEHNGLLNKSNNYFARLSREFLTSVYRYKKTNYEYNSICDTLECAKIPFMPLKGSILRQYYPEPWMRTSCDIDILVHEDDTERAKSVLESELEYTYKSSGSHDLSFFSPSNIHLELHYNLVEDGIASESSEVLKSVWDTAIRRDGFEFCYDMPDEMFYFYHIAHMAKHFENGGCGIRPFIDLWILDNLNSADTEKRNALLGSGNLLKFANVARKLSRVWFEEEEYDSLSKEMEDYILRGGVYGNNENRITLQQQKKGGKLRYAISKIFLPYDAIKFHYPILQKHKWLTPFMQVRRWFKLIFCGGAKRSINELKYNSSVSKEQADRANQLLINIGLK